MATVRIYKVAELLNTSSQEVMALLKRDHGIEVKSASSTIEEVVARQFVERLARQRNIPVPSSAAYADAPAVVRGRKPAPKAPEPQRPATATLPPPRLVKTAKPAVVPAVAEPEPETVAAPEAALAPPPAVDVAPSVPEPEPVPEPVAVVEPPAAEPSPAPAAAKEEPASPEIAAKESDAARVAVSEPSPSPAAPAREPAAPAAAAAGSPAPRPIIPAPTGRVVPPTIRLRVEDPKTGQAPPAPPRRPVLVRPPTSPTPTVSQAPTGNLSRPPGARPGAPGRAPGGRLKFPVGACETAGVCGAGGRTSTGRRGGAGGA